MARQKGRYLLMESNEEEKGIPRGKKNYRDIQTVGGQVEPEWRDLNHRWTS